jgi:integrase
MSIRRDSRSPYWQYNFQIGGRRFFGSTKKTTRREAEAVERQERERAKAHIAQTEAARTSLRLDDVAGRFWLEHGQHGAGAANIERRLALMIEFFGKDKLLTEITGDDVARLVAWRRGHRGKAPGALLAPHTVNHMLETLRSLFSRAKLWGVRFNHEPIWHKLMLPIPSERVRELSDDEADRLDTAARGDYGTFIAFARASGLRLAECLLRWDEVDWSARQIRKPGKGGRLVTVPITSDIRELLWPLQGHHASMVFTYLCERAEHGRVRGQRYPLTYNGVKTYWRRLCKDAGITGLRFHDLRHDFGTKLLRETGNLKLVQRAMNHATITTTTRYAHVLDDEVADAMERVAKLRKNRRARLKVV